MSPAGGSPAPARPTVGTAEHDPAVLPLHLWPSTLGFAGVWLISFGFVLVELLRRAFTPGDGRGEAILGVAAIAVFVLVYLAAFVVPRPVRAWPAWANTILTWLVLAACVAVLTRILGVHALLYSPFLVAAWLFPHRLRVGLIGAGVTVAAVLAAGLLFFPGDPALPVVLGNLAVVLVVLVGMRLAIGRDDRVMEMTHELDLAGQRERLGRDLHDILGHSLTTINVKTQLVHRLIDTCPARAKQEAAEVIALSRTALAEARAAVAELARRCTEAGVPLAHVSTDYVFDGALPVGQEHPVDHPLAPLGVYGQSKAAGEAAVRTVARHWIVRTSWVIGEGKNFVATMASLAERGIDPAVVADQHGRLTFADDLADALLHLVTTDAPTGTFHMANSGDVVTWHDVARWVFEDTGHDAARVSATTTAAYMAGKEGVAPRPTNSALDLGPLAAVGYTAPDQRERLRTYLKR